MKLWGLALLLAALVVPAQSQDVVFEGRPLVRIDADPKESKTTELSSSAGTKYACRIVKKGRSFQWASRDNRKLDRVDAGDYTYYISPEGSGYVKVLKGSGGEYDYMEHLSAGFKTVTYWGKAGTGGE
jgi:hypothetical protein